MDPLSVELLFDEVSGPNPEVDALLARHHALMRSMSPEESCHVMTSDELQRGGARVVMGRLPSGEPVAIGAFMALGDGAAELKSMHCRDDLRGMGLGRALLSHLMATAKDAGMTSLWLETGSEPPFEPARGLYLNAGFEECPPFGSYKLDPLSVFMSRRL